MRLSETEVFGIIKGVSALFPSINMPSVELRLYGSRADDARKGGDIDLLLIVADKKLKTTLIENKHVLLTHIKKNIGEQKIDILIVDPHGIQTDPFIATIYPDSIVLKKW